MDQDDSSTDIRKRTPVEQARAEQSSRQARYEARLRREGFTKTTVYVKSDRLEEVRQFIARVNEA